MATMPQLSLSLQLIRPQLTLRTQLHLKAHIFFTATDWMLVCFSNPQTNMLYSLKWAFTQNTCFAGLIKSQFLRFHRICTQQMDIKSATKIQFSALSTRAYCRSLRKCFSAFLQISPIEVSPLLSVFVTYAPSTCKLVRVIKSHFQKLVQEIQMLGLWFMHVYASVLQLEEWRLLIKSKKLIEITVKVQICLAYWNFWCHVLRIIPPELRKKNQKINKKPKQRIFNLGFSLFYEQDVL